MEDQNFKNYIEDDFNGCCCATAIGADGSESKIEADLGAKAKKLAYGVVLLVGVVVSSTWLYNKYIK